MYCFVVLACPSHFLFSLTLLHASKGPRRGDTPEIFDDKFDEGSLRHQTIKRGHSEFTLDEKGNHGGGGVFPSKKSHKDDLAKKGGGLRLPLFKLPASITGGTTQENKYVARGITGEKTKDDINVPFLKDVILVDSPEKNKEKDVGSDAEKLKEKKTSDTGAGKDGDVKEVVDRGKFAASGGNYSTIQNVPHQPEFEYDSWLDEFC